MLADVMRALATRAHLKALELVCSVDAEVPNALYGDGGRLRQVLMNLVGNAIKFTAAGEVVVLVESAPGAAADRAEVTLRFSIRDTGIGISREKQKVIFRAFEQEDTSTTRKYGGTGLGLTIAARLVDMMGGQITVDSEPGRGSTFAFSIPFRTDVEASAPLAGMPAPSLPGVRVLIVDDNASSRQTLERWLQAWRMEPTTASDAMAAMDTLWHGLTRREPYALALVDARMPHTDGFALAGRIRERPELVGTRLILLTSGDSPLDLEHSRELGIDAHLLKPVSQEELLETVRQTMSRRHGAPAAPLGMKSLRVAPVELAPDVAPVPLRILVAEDNQVNAHVVQQMLLERGHAVRLAGNGREALSLIERGVFDLLLLDLHMPEVDGFQVITELRERERGSGAHLPVVALTARSRPVDRVRSLAIGMDDFLTKPIDRAALRAAIDRLHPQTSSGPPPRLIAAKAMLAACGGDSNILAELCAALRVQLPDDLARLELAFQGGDAASLREAAHSLCGTLAAFSTEAFGLASELEEHAASGRIVDAHALVERIRQTVPSLLQAIEHVSVESLRGQVAVG
jgi:CheY-like chemotaxis protein